jgi:DNA-binding CsgD family transcriptional regulator
MNLQNSPVTEGDFLEVVRILADIVTMEGTLDDKRVKLMGEIAHLIGTDSWVWGFAPLLKPGEQPVYLFQNLGGFDEERMSRLLMAVEHTDTGAMTAPLAEALIQTGAHVTRLRKHIVTDQRFESSPAEPYWRAADIGPLILSARPLEGRGNTIIGFYRPVSAPPFTEREARIAHIILTGVAWLHEASTPNPVVHDIPKLPPRCRLILNQLVHGRVRKEIARDLGISLHTVNDYIKQIFRHFDVHSQMQLISRLKNGDGHDVKQLPQAGPQP